MKDLDELRRAQADLEPGRVIEALDDTLEAWRAPDSLWRARLKRLHRSYSPEVLERGVRAGLEEWTGERLALLRASEMSGACLAPPVCAVWLAGSIPTGAFAAALLPLLAGSSVYLKASSADPTSPRVFAESLRAADPLVGAAIRVGNDPAALGRADAVVAYGRDETLAEIRARVPPHAIFVGYGHKLSVAAVGPEAPLERAAEALAFDAALYDGRGCLSPAYAFALDRPPGRAAALAEALAGALAKLARELPRGPLTPAEQAHLQALRAGLAAREDTRLWMSRGSLEWTVILSTFEKGPPMPGTLRTLPVIPVRDEEELGAWWQSLRPHLSSVGHAGFGDGAAALAPLALHAGASRLCALGRMQLPPLEWHHDGQSPLRPLLRWLDVEDLER